MSKHSWIVIAVLALSPSIAFSQKTQTFDWDNAVDGNWTDDSKWSGPAGEYPDDNLDIASISKSAIVTLQSAATDLTIRQLTVDAEAAAGDVTLELKKTLTVDITSTRVQGDDTYKAKIAVIGGGFETDQTLILSGLVDFVTDSSVEIDTLLIEFVDGRDADATVDIGSSALFSGVGGSGNTVAVTVEAGDSNDAVTLTLTGIGTLEGGTVTVNEYSTLECSAGTNVSATTLNLDGGSSAASAAEISVAGDETDCAVTAINMTGYVDIVGVDTASVVGTLKATGTTTLDDTGGTVDVDSTASLDLGVVSIVSDANPITFDVDLSGSQAYLLAGAVTVESDNQSRLAQFNISGASTHAELDSLTQTDEGALFAVSTGDAKINDKLRIESIPNISVGSGAVLEAGHIEVASTGSISYGTSELRTAGTLVGHGDFQSAVDSMGGVWDAASSWEVYDGRTGSWEAATGSNYPGPGDRVTIRTDDVITIDDDDVSGLRRLTIESDGEIKIEDGITLELERGSLKMNSNGKISFLGSGSGSSTVAELKLDDAIANGLLDIPDSNYGKISSSTQSLLGPDCAISVVGDLTLANKYVHMGSLTVSGSGDAVVSGIAQSGSIGTWAVNGTFNATLTFDAGIFTNKLDGEISVDGGKLILESFVDAYGGFSLKGTSRVDAIDGATTWTFDAYGEHVP